MKNPRALLAVSLAWLVLFSMTACSKKAGDEKHDHQEHEHEEASHHHHVAPHGGTLVELGEHAFAVEFVRDEPTGALIAYLLDAHAENFVRSPFREIALVATVNGVEKPLSLAATGSEATGETVGDTSAFVAQAEWLKTTPSFDVVIPALEIRGVKFTNVKFNFPKGAEDHDGDH